MDEYSYISENGTVRQIRDLVAKAKDEEQDATLQSHDVMINGKMPKYYIDSLTALTLWTTSYTEGSGSTNLTLNQDGLYKFDFTVTNPVGKASNNVSVTLANNTVVANLQYNQQGSASITVYAPLKAQTITLNHSASGGNADGVGSITVSIVNTL